MAAKGMTTKKLVQTGILLALCLVFQLLKGISVYITGPMVNAILILASLSCGWYSGVLIAVVAPLTAMLIGATPIVNAVPAMLPVIMIGNALIAVSAWLFRNRMLPLGLAIGSCLKAGFLWLSVWYVVLPFFWQRCAGKNADGSESYFFCDTADYGSHRQCDCLAGVDQTEEVSGDGSVKCSDS